MLLILLALPFCWGAEGKKPTSHYSVENVFKGIRSKQTSLLKEAYIQHDTQWRYMCRSTVIKNRNTNEVDVHDSVKSRIKEEHDATMLANIIKWIPAKTIRNNVISANVISTKSKFHMQGTKKMSIWRITKAGIGNQISITSERFSFREGSTHWKEVMNCQGSLMKDLPADESAAQEISNKDRVYAWQDKQEILNESLGHVLPKGLRRDTLLRNGRAKRDTSAGYNETRCYLFTERGKYIFHAITEASLNTIENQNYGELLHPTGTPPDSCYLEDGYRLNLCFLFSDRNQEIRAVVHCLVHLLPVHSSSKMLVFDEMVHSRCRHVPVYLSHFNFRLEIVPFLNETQCENSYFYTASPGKGITNELHSVTNGSLNSSSLNTWQISAGGSSSRLAFPMTEGLMTSVCVMEEPTKRPFSCLIPFNNWIDKQNTNCPPIECLPPHYDPRKNYNCIPYIARHICYSPVIHESAICQVNMTDESYRVSKTLTPFRLDILSKTEHYPLLLTDLLLENFPGITSDNEKTIFNIPVDSFGLEPLSEDSCLEYYRFLLPNMKTVGSGTIVASRTPSTDVWTLKILDFVAVGIVGLGGIALIVNICQLIHTARSRALMVVDIYVLAVVLSLTMAFIPEIVIIILVITRQIKMTLCTVRYVNEYALWMRNISCFTIIALCSDRKKAISQPLTARSEITKKHAAMVSLYITISTFAAHVLGSIILEIESYVHQQPQCFSVSSLPWWQTGRFYVGVLWCLAYVVGWFLLLQANAVMIYHLIKSTRQWQREFPKRQVVAMVALSTCFLLVSMVNAVNAGINIYVGILGSNLVESNTGLSYSRIYNKLILAVKIGTTILSMQYLMVGVCLFINYHRNLLRACALCSCFCRGHNNSEVETPKMEQRAEHEKEHEIELECSPRTISGAVISQ